MEHSIQTEPITLESMIRSETPSTFHLFRFTAEEANIVMRSIGFSRNLLHQIFDKTDDNISKCGYDVAMMDTTKLVDESGRVGDMKLDDTGHVKALGCIVEFYSLQAGINPSENSQLEQTAAATLAAELLVKGNPFPDAPTDSILGT